MRERTYYFDYLEDACLSVGQDIDDLGITVRDAALIIGIPKSSLNDFIRFKAKKPRRKTIQALLHANLWTDETRKSLVDLLEFNNLAAKGLGGRRRLVLVTEKISNDR